LSAGRQGNKLFWACSRIPRQPVSDKAGLLRGSLFWSCEYPVSLSAEMKQVRKKPLAKRQAPSSPNQRKLALLRLVGRQARVGRLHFALQNTHLFEGGDEESKKRCFSRKVGTFPLK